MAEYTKEQHIENANGSITVIGAVPIEPPRPDPKDDKIFYSELRKRYRWTDADYQTAQTYAFPKAIGFTHGGSWISPTRQAVFSRTQVAKWHAEMLQFAAKLPKRF